MWTLLDGKKVQECDYVFGSSTTFQRRKEWICESRCRQVSVRLYAFEGFFLPLNPSTTTVYACSAFNPSLRFTLSLQSAFYTQSAFYPWSAVCSPQSSFYTDRSKKLGFRVLQGWRLFLFRVSWFFTRFHSSFLLIIAVISSKRPTNEKLIILGFASRLAELKQLPVPQNWSQMDDRSWWKKIWRAQYF